MALAYDERESYIEKRVVEYAKRGGWYCRKFTSPNHRGVPDHLFMAHGLLFLIEFKSAATMKPTPLQQHEHDRLRHFGIDVKIINNIDKGKPTSICGQNY